MDKCRSCNGVGRKRSILWKLRCQECGGKGYVASYATSASSSYRSDPQALRESPRQASDDSDVMNVILLHDILSSSETPVSSEPVSSSDSCDGSSGGSSDSGSGGGCDSGGGGE